MNIDGTSTQKGTTVQRLNHAINIIWLQAGLCEQSRAAVTAIEEGLFLELNKQNTDFAVWAKHNGKAD